MTTDPQRRGKAEAAVHSALGYPPYESPGYDVPTRDELNGHHAENASRFRVLTAKEAMDQRPPRGLLGDILDEHAFTIMYAATGRWKTFIALDWSCSITLGRPWLGKEPIQGAVVYIAAEGGYAIGKRIKAWCITHGVGDVPGLVIVPDAVNLLLPEHVADLIESVRKVLCDRTPVLFVFDTLARSMASRGNENDVGDTSQMLSGAHTVCGAFHDAGGLFIHHMGYDKSHMRGSTAIAAAADAVLRIEADDESNLKLECGDVVTLRSEKPRDREGFDDIALTTKKVEWDDGDDEDGEDSGSKWQSSLAVVEASIIDKPRQVMFAPTRPQRGQFPDDYIRAWDTLVKLCDVSPNGVISTIWKTACAKRGIAHSTFFRAVKRLTETGWVREVANQYVAVVPDALENTL